MELDLNQFDNNKKNFIGEFNFENLKITRKYLMNS